MVTLKTWKQGTCTRENQAQILRYDLAMARPASATGLSLICGQYVLQEAAYWETQVLFICVGYRLDEFLPKSEEGENRLKIVGLFVILDSLSFFEWYLLSPLLVRILQLLKVLAPGVTVFCHHFPLLTLSAVLKKTNSLFSLIFFRTVPGSIWVGDTCCYFYSCLAFPTTLRNCS